MTGKLGVWAGFRPWDFAGSVLVPLEGAIVMARSCNGFRTRPRKSRGTIAAPASLVWVPCNFRFCRLVNFPHWRCSADVEHMDLHPVLRPETMMALSEQPFVEVIALAESLHTANQAPHGPLW